MFNKMMVESYVQQNDGEKLSLKNGVGILISILKMMVEKIQQINGEKLGYNKMMVKMYVQQNDGGKLR